jgi:hypothetical protein
MPEENSPPNNELSAKKAKISGFGVVLRQGREVKDDKPAPPTAEKKSD